MYNADWLRRNVNKDHVNTVLSQTLEAARNDDESAIRCLGLVVVDLIQTQLAFLNQPVTYLVPVPYRLEKLPYKKVDLKHLLAIYVASHPNIRCKTLQALSRFRDIKSVLPSLDDHLASIDISDKMMLPIGKKNAFILLDDIIDTGFTMNACIMTLDIQGYSGKKLGLCLGKFVR